MCLIHVIQAKRSICYDVFLLWVLVISCKTISSTKTGHSKLQISAEVPDAEFLSLPRVNYEGWSDPCFYFSMEMIMEVWKNSSVNINYGKGSNSLLSLFINKCFSSPHSWSNKDAGKSRQPFINIEGNSFQKRDRVAKAVSRSLRGQLLGNPPRCMEKVAYIYSRPHDLHRPFSAIGQWASSHAAKAYWVRKPVVMTGYWYHQVATTAADLVFSGIPLPATNGSAFHLPGDLIEPDLAVFVDSQHADDSWEAPSAEDPRTEPGWMDIFTKTFKLFPQAEIVELKWTNESDVIENILGLVRNRLGTKFKTDIK